VKPSLNKRASCQAGFGLLEMLVTVVIALVMSVAIFTVLSRNEGLKRTTTSVNDINQTGAILSYQLDKLLRSAGSGFSLGTAGSGGSWSSIYGCQLNASLSGAGTILPFPGTMPAPFSSLNGELGGVYRLAPLVIANGAITPNASGQPTDALIVMKGNGGVADVPTFFLAKPEKDRLNVINTIGFKVEDIVLVMGPVPNSCMIEQVSSAFSGEGTRTILPLGGNYYANPIGNVDVTTLGGNGGVVSIGNASNNPPSFQIIGIGDNNVLYSYDLLRIGDPNKQPQAMADGVFELHALYGLDNDLNGTIDSWVKPEKDTPFDYRTLENGSAASQANLQRIKAIRLGLIMRSSLPEKATVPPATSGPLTLFSDLGSGLTYTRNLNSSEQNYRYRIVEATIPLRNPMTCITSPC